MVVTVVCREYYSRRSYTFRVVGWHDDDEPSINAVVGHGVHTFPSADLGPSQWFSE